MSPAPRAAARNRGGPTVRRPRAGGAAPAATPRTRGLPLLLRFGVHSPDLQAGHLVAVGLGEPDVAVRAGDDALELPVAVAHGEALDLAGGRDPADLVRADVGEPEVPVGSGRDALGRALLPADGVLGELPVGCDPADHAGMGFG